MTRVPKFRAWVSDKEKMLSVEEIGWDSESVGVFCQGEEDWLSADDLVLMQSTGLKDKNGVEIFEKDIVSRVLNEKGVKTYGIVEYIDGMYLVDGIEGLNSHDWLIIGNIYEDRQSLKADGG